MTTTMPIPAVPAAPVPALARPALLAVGVNLLPPEITAVRHVRKVRRLVVVSLAGFTVLMLAWYGLATFQTSVARDELTAAEDEAHSLLQQHKKYNDLTNAQTQSSAISAQLAGLLATDLRWSELVRTLHAAAPAGVDVESVSSVLAEGAGTTVADPASRAKDAPRVTIGTITVSGIAASKSDVAAYLDALDKVARVANPLVADVMEQGRGVQFTVRLDITSDALGGRYTQPNTEPKKDGN